MWWIRGGIDPEPFGERRVVLHVVLPEGRRTRFWFVIDPHDVSLCFTDPGHEVDLVLEAPLGELYQLWEGVYDLHTGLRDDRIRLSGPRDLRLVFPDTLKLSPVAPHVRRALARRPERARPAVLAAAACLGWLPFLWRPLSPDEGRLPDRRLAVGAGIVAVRRLLGRPATGADRAVRAGRRDRRPLGPPRARHAGRGRHGPARRGRRPAGRPLHADRAGRWPPGPPRCSPPLPCSAARWCTASCSRCRSSSPGSRPPWRPRSARRPGQTLALGIAAGSAGMLAVLTKQSQVDVFVAVAGAGPPDPPLAAARRGRRRLGCRAHPASRSRSATVSGPRPPTSGTR